MNSLRANNFLNKIKSICTPLPGSLPETIVFKLSVKKRFEGVTILDMYATLFPHQDRKVWEDKIVAGMVTVNGEAVSPDFVLKAGWITQNKVEDRIEPDVSIDIDLIYENENFIVVNKPAPLPIHPAGRYNRNSLTKILEKTFPEWNLKVIHRIDANTTGIVVLAKNSITANEIAKQFENHSVKKEYIALVEGIVKKDSFVINTSISKNKINAGGREVVEEGFDADTTVSVLEKYQNTSLLSVIPKSGRTNQIRLHLASIGHPIVGDVGYKNIDFFKNNPLTYPQDTLCLHAKKLAFQSAGKEYSFETELPLKLRQ